MPKKANHPRWGIVQIKGEATFELLKIISMKQCVLFLILCFVLPLGVQAGNISGKIISSTSEPIITASVVLLKANDNSLVKSDLSDDNGAFVFPEIQDGVYVLKVTALGYSGYSSDAITFAGRDVSMGAIQLLRAANQLKEVNVTAQRSLIEVHADKLVVNVENSVINTGSSAMEILGRSPGVTVDQNDNIVIKGKQGVNVMIDGKQMAVSGADLANILKAMPSNQIKQIEVISNPGARYDAAGTAGVINIVTKRDQRMGMNGSLNASYGQGVYPKYSAGGNLNFRNKKWSSYVSYNYSKRWWFNHLKLDRKFYDEKDALQFSYVQDNFMKMPMNNHSGSVGMDYSLNDKTIIGVAATAGTTGFDQTANNASRALDGNNDVVYYFNTLGNHRQDYYNYSANANLRQRYNELGKQLSMDVDYARYWSQSNQNFQTQYTRPDGVMYQPDYFMRSDLSGVTQIRSAKADYTYPVNEKLKFEAGAKSSYVTSDNEPLFYEKTLGDFALDVKRSNHFIYKENINAGYVNMNKEWTKWSTQLGLRLENTNVTAEQVTLDSTYKTSYTQLFPSFAVQRHVNDKHDLGLTLSRRIDRPNYQQLNPFKYFIDNTTYRAGYPYLRPSLTYSVELSHTFKQKFLTSLSYSVTTNSITEVIQPSDTEDSITVQINKNLARMDYYAFSCAYPFQVTKWWSNVSNVVLYYAHYTGFIANTNLSNGAPAFQLNITNNFTLPKKFRAELGGWYQSRQIYGFMDMKPMWALNAGIQKTIMKDNGTLRLSVQDMFWTSLPRATSVYNSYREDFIVNRETRQVSLSFSYRFGNSKLQPTRKRSGGAEDEKSRAGNAG